MTDSEIVKALEYCTNCVCNTIDGEDDCPLVKMSFCKNFLMKQSLDLINRLQAKLDEAEDTIQFADKELKKAEAENERLKKEIEVQERVIDNEDFRIERKISEAKAEAYKEFAEKVETFVIPQKADGYTREIVLKRDIDNLYKELVGDK